MLRFIFRSVMKTGEPQTYVELLSQRHGIFSAVNNANFIAFVSLTKELSPKKVVAS